MSFVVMSPVIQVNFPRFYGYSHMSFEPLKNSYQTFQISVEFKVNAVLALTLFMAFFLFFFKNG